jgi:hypothetical protein
MLPGAGTLNVLEPLQGGKGLKVERGKPIAEDSEFQSFIMEPGSSKFALRP